MAKTLSQIEPNVGSIYCYLITYAHVVRPSQSVLSTGDLNLVFVWVGHAKGAVVVCPGYIRSRDGPAGFPEQCRSASGQGVPSGRGFANSSDPLEGTAEKPRSDRDYWEGGISGDGGLKDSEAPDAHFQGQVGC